MKSIWIMLLSLFLYSCGGGDGAKETASPASPSIGLTYHSSNQGRALINVDGLSETIFTIENSSSAQLTITTEMSDLVAGFSVTNNQCQGAVLATSDTCQLTVQYLRDDNSKGSIKVSGIAQNGNDHYRSTILFPVFGIVDPFNSNMEEYAGHIDPNSNFCSLIDPTLVDCHLYKLGQVTSPAPDAWSTGAASYPLAFNAPLIQTYFPDQFLFMTPLVVKHSCSAAEFYFVAQYGSTVSGAIDTNNRQDNVFIKFHPLMANGVTSGVAGHAVNFSGRLNLSTSSGDNFVENTSQSAHDSVWSGASNVAGLQQLLNTNNNTYVTSSYKDSNSGKTVYAVNSLLNKDDLQALLIYLQTNPNPHEIDTPADAPDLQEPTFQASVRQYREIVAQHCLTGFN
ncbi:hypothetical protein [Vibrio pectenicida]|uniref:hypothetical protein n=1 Tax=Vibrio pectenicida TaxID=62763 RepID=UPI001C11B832|nr:hypothetical protein [Vibrio pectenicida]